MTFIGNSFITRAWRALALGAALLAAGVPASADQAKGGRPRVDSFVEQALRDGRDVPVIVRYADDSSLARGKKGNGSGKRAVKRQLKALRALSMKVNHRALRALADNEDGGVLSVSYDAPVGSSQLLGDLLYSPPPANTIDGSGVRVARTRYRVDGAGVAVAIIDSGVAPHADLPASRIAAFVDFVNGRTTAYDDYGHGTHVAGIVAGSGSASGGKYAGAAPGASIVALKVLDATGAGSTSNVMAALEWVLNNHAKYGIRVVNLSLGHPIYEPAATDPMVQMVEALTQRGLVVVVSAGNFGRNSLGQTVYGSITSPANAQGAVTVGALDSNYTDRRSDDGVASFSSRGPTRFDRFVKPDVLAPGFHIASLAAQGSTLVDKYPNLALPGGYLRLNGTSMAAPVVAGSAALLLQSNPSLSSHTVKGILQFTSQRLRDLDVMTQGAGQINVPGAVRLAKLVDTRQDYEKRWVKGSRRPVGADLLFGESAFWGRAILWGTQVKAGTNSLFVRLQLWDDNIVWGYFFDNIVWSMFDDNIVWSMFFDNIVWSMDDNIVWGLTDDNIVWGFDDAVSALDDNIVWSMDDNIVWGLSEDAVQAFSEELLGQSIDEVGGQSVLIEGEVR
jgi:serine protease AprX